LKVSELSRASTVSIPSIKYYLREGLLHSGASTANNQAEYDEDHVRRLRLIRALIDIGGLPIAGVRGVLAAVDDESTKMHDAFGAVMHGLSEPPPAEPSRDVAAALAEVRRWLRARGWRIKPKAPAPHALAELIVTLRQFDFPVAMADLDAAADAAEQSAEFEVAYSLAKPDRTAAVENMLVGTVVYERVLAEIRRLALEAVSARMQSNKR
jgi:DNA-binding transcriptional MerR regulator